MRINYDTVGDFYAALSQGLRSLVANYGEDATFDGDPALQLSQSEINLPSCKPVICIKTALAAFDAIVVQGEGAPAGFGGLALSEIPVDPRGAPSITGAES